jgi:hypothetical protein
MKQKSWRRFVTCQEGGEMAGYNLSHVQIGLLLDGPGDSSY